MKKKEGKKEREGERNTSSDSMNKFNGDKYSIFHHLSSYRIKLAQHKPAMMHVPDSMNMLLHTVNM